MASPETASEYLDSVNWKAFVEYLTAEIILHRPKKPIHYVLELINQKIKESEDSEGNDFGASEINKWLQRCYSEASSRADKVGIISNLPYDNL